MGAVARGGGAIVKVTVGKLKVTISPAGADAPFLCAIRFHDWYDVDRPAGPGYAECWRCGARRIVDTNNDGRVDWAWLLNKPDLPDGTEAPR